MQNFEDILKLRDQYVGPTDESHWVMPGWLLVGAYPASVNDEENYSLLSSILVQGVSMFVCVPGEASQRYAVLTERALSTRSSAVHAQQRCGNPACVLSRTAQGRATPGTAAPTALRTLISR